jgi:hypothetical protein
MCTSAGSVTTMWSSSVLHSANVWPVHDLIVPCFRGPVMPTRTIPIGVGEVLVRYCWGIGQKPYTLETSDLPNS